MAAAVVVSEIALDDSGPGVEQTPAENTERATHGTQVVERSGDGQNADGEDDFEEDDGGARPFDRAEVDTASRLEDFVFLVGVEDAAGCWR